MKNNIENYKTSERKRIAINKILDVNMIDGASWDVFEDYKKKYIEEYKIYGKDPLESVSDGIVAIDFGTTSTVVLLLDEKDRITSINIGEISSSSKDDINKLIENPTILVFANMKEFRKKYSERKHRPYTNYTDLRSSWYAVKNKQEYRKCYSELKQWALTNYGNSIFKDEAGYNFELKNINSVNPEVDIDLIEYYAYYIGSYINSQIRKDGNKIFTQYYLSFPINFDENIKKLVRRSFERGIKKSIPESVLQKNKIRVKFICSEPTAYALTCFEIFNIKPEKDIIYSIYDFGGGTTDFDYGILKENKDGEQKYLVKSLLMEGKKFAGGENIIQKLAIKTILSSQQNIKILKEKKIRFFLPEHSESLKDDYVNGYSQREIEISTILEKQKNIQNTYNLSVLSKKLDLVWKDIDSIEEEGILEIIKKNGNVEMDFMDEAHEEIKSIPIKFDYKILVNEIRKNMKETILFFWENYIKFIKLAVENESIDFNNTKRHIFLAGNSTKSKIFMEVFLEIYNKINVNKDLVLHYPLGSAEAEKELEKFRKDSSQIRPNAKTGVAYGILKSIPDLSDYKLMFDYEKEFKHIISNKKQEDILNKYSEFNVWYFVQNILEDSDVTYYYENGIRKNINVDNLLEIQYLYMRIIDTDEIEYVILTNSEKKYIDTGVDEKLIKKIQIINSIE